MKADEFSQFPTRTLDFLTDLSANNDRDRFAQNDAFCRLKPLFDWLTAPSR
ncbi:hypothetical protein NTH_00296 [Nitratireductor thuwali]|uniref:Uncharacterized protein n=2 Tax=Nitratireductor thuwali TaxID=2267699 RepID=A0ABY5MEL5_9HYPH|nr:hypothetical protein NTH_00296 [Nitratireductor thuwali]